MKLNKFTGSDLIKIGYPQNFIMGQLLETLDKTQASGVEISLSMLKELKNSPLNWISHPLWGSVAKELFDYQMNQSRRVFLLDQPVNCAIYGSRGIDASTLNQMELALRLPVSVAGALMPDGHQGYGLPIGGVLATRNAVIPYGVGVDIGCRMSLSFLDTPFEYFNKHLDSFSDALLKWTRFGAGAFWDRHLRAQHEVLDQEEFQWLPIVKELKDTAYNQLGTSGGGNHFVEWGLVELIADDIALNLRAGNYIALLSHSGSRALGAKIAEYYTKIAQKHCILPKQASKLAYLDLASSEGQEYWIAMNLAGNYSAACHQVIHERLIKSMGGEILAKVENHHNFAWKEQFDGKDVIVHRKGATPAHENLMGIIPGSMTAPGFVVRGKGNPNSLNSASHGAGRAMSRTQASKTIQKEDWDQMIEDHGIRVFGAGLDEAPKAYKNIEEVMRAQSDLVNIVARFIPKIVRMADEESIE